MGWGPSARSSTATLRLPRVGALRRPGPWPSCCGRGRRWSPSRRVRRYPPAQGRSEMDQGALKKMAAAAAVEYVKDGQIVGLGTGSTLRYVVAKLGERVKKGLRIRGVATSLETARLATVAGIPLLADDAEWGVDLALDGADQVDPRLNLIKGGGGALLKEKIVAAAAGRFVVRVGESKRVAGLGGGVSPPGGSVPFGGGGLAERFGRVRLSVPPPVKKGGPFRHQGGDQPPGIL